MIREADEAGRSTYSILTTGAAAAIGLIQAGGPLLARFLRECVDPPFAGDTARSSIRRRRLVIDGGVMDEALLLSPPGPVRSVWIGVHGNPAILRACADQFRRRGFEQVEIPSDLWPTDDSIEREIAAALPRIRTRAGVDWLISQGPLLRAAHLELAAHAGGDVQAARAFAQCILSGRSIIDWFVHPLRVVLVGPPNAGKSTLMNRLTDSRVSIVLPTPGTTRDFVTAPGEIAGYPVEWIDTAGLRSADDPVETEGIARARDLVRQVDVVCLLNDATGPSQVPFELETTRPIVRVRTKIDLAPMRQSSSGVVEVSALLNFGGDQLEHAILSAVGRPVPADLRYPTAFSSAIVASIERQIGELS